MMHIKQTLPDIRTAVGSLIPVCLVVLEEVLLVLQGISNEFLVLNITLVC
jgi:hypothetical protein